MQDEPGPDGPRIERIAPDPAMAARLLALLHAAFAYMEGRIDPPSSLLRMTLDDVMASCAAGTVLGVFDGETLIGCAFLKPQDGALHMGKLAVHPSRQGGGVGRMLLSAAERIARKAGLPALTLQTRIELTGNHAAFARFGFVRTAETAHPGYDRPTSITMIKQLDEINLPSGDLT